MIIPAILGLLLGLFRFNFADNILKIATPGGANLFEIIPYMLLSIALFLSLHDISISSISDLSSTLPELTASIMLRNISVGVMFYVIGYAAKNLLFSGE